MAAPTVAQVETELTAARVAVAGYTAPTGQQVSNRNPLTILDTIERLEARIDRKAEGIAQLNVGFG